MWLSVFIAVVLHLVGIVHSAAVAGCTDLPSWTFSDVVKSGRDAVGTSGSASIKVTNNKTNTTDTLKCTSLVAGYRCQFNGTPTDKDLKITLQFQMEVLIVSVEGDLTCNGSSQHFGGNGNIELSCTSARIGGEVSCNSVDGDDGKVTVKAVPI